MEDFTIAYSITIADEESNKYYTPSIDEFHVGFEYEMKSSFGDGTIKTQEQYDLATWDKFVCGINTFPYIERTMTGRNSLQLPPAIRIKHLDREDIESLGWEYEKEHAGTNEISFSISHVIDTSNGPEPQLDYLYLDYDTETHYLRIYWSGQGDITRFSGIIKNKSELKKLMEQLGIL